MKVLYCVVVLSLIEYGLTAVPVKPSQHQQQLLQFYEQQVKKIDREEFAVFKQLFEKLLQDDRIKRGSTPIFQTFKKNANEFLKKYPNASDTELTRIIANTVKIVGSINNHKDVQPILKAMSENGIGKIFENYTKNYVFLVKDKFIPKFEEYKKHLKPEELKQQHALMEWFKNLKNCSNYDCYSKYFDKFPQYMKH